MRAWRDLLRGQGLGTFLEWSGQGEPERRKAFRMETSGRALLRGGQFWLELGSNRFAPDSASLRYATPGVSCFTLGRRQPSARNAYGSIPLTTARPSGGRGHLDTMRFTASIRARTPRADCLEHGLRIIGVPGSAPRGRYTLRSESIRHRGRRRPGLGSKIRCRPFAALAYRTAGCRTRCLNKPAFSGPPEDRGPSRPRRTLDWTTSHCDRKSSTQSLNTVSKMMSEH